MGFNPNWLLNSFLWNYPGRIPLGKCHYLTGVDLINFKNMTCIENTLTNLTCNCKQLCNSIRPNFRQ